MLIAHLLRGPLDNEYLPLPTEEPWPRFVVPEKRTLLVCYFYLLAGQEEETIWSYLYDEDFLTVNNDDVYSTP